MRCLHPFAVLSTAAGLTVRLNGSTTGAGRVEVFYGGVWGTVCTNGWTPLDATVVCKQLGYDSAIATVTTSFGPGDGMIWMENVRCNGIESKLSDCPFNGWGVSSCSHFQDVGVTCNSKHAHISIVLHSVMLSLQPSILLRGRADWWMGLPHFRGKHKCSTTAVGGKYVALDLI